MEFCFFHRESEHLCLGRCVLFVPLLSCLSVALVLTVASLRVIYLFVIFEIHSLHVNLYPFLLHLCVTNEAKAVFVISVAF